MNFSFFKSAFDPLKLLGNYSRVLRSSLHVNSIYLMLNGGMTAVFSFLFWVVVARYYSAEDVGLSSAAISAGSLLAFIGSLGLDYGIIRFLPSFGKERSALINVSLLIVAAAALLVSIIYLLGIPLWSPAFSALRQNTFFLLAFIGFTLASSLSAIINSAFMSLRGSKFVLFQSIFVGMIKLLLVIVLVSLFGSVAILSSWAISLLIALVLGLLVFMPRLYPDYAPGLSLKIHNHDEIFKFSLINCLSHGLYTLPSWILPIITVNILGAEQNAYFYIALGVAGILFVIPGATSSSLFVEGSNEIAHLKNNLIKSLKFTFIIIIPAIILFALVGDKILMLFGRKYSSEGSHLFWFFAPSVLPMTINTHFLSVARIYNRLKLVIVVTASIAAGILILSYLFMGSMGITGLALAWLISHTAIALIIIPLFIKIYKNERKNQ